MGKALVVYDTVYGNTEKVAKALAKGLEEGGVVVDSVRVDAAKFDELGMICLLLAVPFKLGVLRKQPKRFWRI